jgi:ABC-type transport system substrate-binding protein
VHEGVIDMKRKILIGLLVTLLSATTLGCQSTEYERRTDASNTLYVGYVASSFPVSFMPWLSRDGIAPTIASMLYSTLFNYNEDTGLFEGLIAKEWYYVDEDGNPLVKADGSVDYDRVEEIYGGSDKTYLPVKVVLYDDLTWSDGEPVTVEDVYYTFDIATNSALSNHAGALAWTTDLQHEYSNGELVAQGMFTYDRGAAEMGYEIDESERDTVIYLHVNKVLGAVTTLFSTILILPEHIWEPIVSPTNQLNSKDPTAETTYQYEHPVGCGPYVLDIDHSNAQVIVLERREDYPRTAADGSALYKVDRIKFLLYQEQNVAIYSLLKGHIDILDSTISSNYLSLFEEREDIFVSNAPGLYLQTLVLNVNPVTSERNPIRDLLNDERVRRAIALAIDQEELINRILNGSGTTVTAGLMSPSNPLIFNPDAILLPTDADERLAEANALLDEVVPTKDEDGYRLLDGAKVSFDILGSTSDQETIAFLQVQLQKIGIDVEFAAEGSTPEKTYLYNSKFDMTIQGVTFTISNLDIMYLAHFVTLGTSSNYGRFADATLTSLIQEMRTTLNLDHKYELILEIQSMIAAEYYKIPLYCQNVLSVARTDRYTGYVVVRGSSVFNTDTLQNLVRSDAS